MATSKTRELEDYFERIVRKREGDLPGRRKGDEHLSQTHALYHGDPAPWALTPKIFDKNMTALLKEAAERMYGIMDKVTRAFCPMRPCVRGFAWIRLLLTCALWMPAMIARFPLRASISFLTRTPGRIRFASSIPMAALEW
ncbi:MAG: hypothetical protein ACLTYW_11350 [Collinsella sp.]